MAKLILSSMFSCCRNIIKNIQERYKKDLHDPDNHDGVISDLEPDILECEVTWALESITMNKRAGQFFSWLSSFPSILDRVG